MPTAVDRLEIASEPFLYENKVEKIVVNALWSIMTAVTLGVAGQRKYRLRMRDRARPGRLFTIKIDYDPVAGLETLRHEMATIDLATFIGRYGIRLLD